MKNYKPEGYNSLSPYLIVEGAEQMINFLIEVFGGTPTRRFNTPEGKIIHAEVKLDDSVVMIAEANEKFHANLSVLHLYVENSDEIHQRAIAFGCEDLGAPKTAEGDSDKRGMFKDFAGNLWAVSTQQAF